MLVFLDSVIVIYAVEGLFDRRRRARAHLNALTSEGHHFVVSDLTRLECMVKPSRSPSKPENIILSEAFDLFLNDPDIIKAPLTSEVFAQATLIRALDNFKLADALHLATAIEAGCGSFLTNDIKLARFRQLPIALLP